MDRCFCGIIKRPTNHSGSVESFDNVLSEIARSVLLVSIREELMCVVLEVSLGDCVIADRVVFFIGLFDIFQPIHQGQKKCLLIGLLAGLDSKLQRVNSGPIGN